MTASTRASAASTAADRIGWNRERLLLYPCLALLIAYICVVITAVVLSFPDLVDFLGRPIGNDFIQFWSAARLAVDGRPEAVYSWRAIAEMHQVAVPTLRDLVVPWHYPPTFLLVVFPLGYLPYLAALGVFIAATTVLWAALIRRLFADPRAWVVAAAFPAGLLNFHDGQNGFLTAGLAAFALLALERRPVAAGVLIGLLAIKPHLAVLFPVALAAERRWTSFRAAAITAIAFSVLSVAVFGWPTMLAFWKNLRSVMRLVDGHMLDWGLVTSVYVSALSFGLSRQAAAALQVISVFGAAICTWLVWHTRSAPREAKMATLCAASLLISPYVFAYDQTWLGLSIAWLVSLGMQRGFAPGERELLLAVGLGTGLAPFIYDHAGVQLGCTLPLALTILGLVNALRSDDRSPAHPTVDRAAGTT